MPKRKATAAQLRNLAKGRRKLAAMRRAGTVRRKKTPTRRARPRRKNPDISHEAWELILFAQSSGEMQPQRDVIIKNVIRKINRGVYDASKAPALWKYWMDDAARRYTKEHDVGGGFGVFNAPIRREAAAYIAPIYYDEIKSGEYSHLLAFKKTKKKTAKKRNPAFGNFMTAKKRNPAYGNFMTARNVLKTGRTTNPQKRRLVPSGRRVPQHYIIASIDPRPPNRIVYWGAFGWGPAGKALIFPNATDARKIAEKKMKRPAVVAKPKTAERLLREALTK